MFSKWNKHATYNTVHTLSSDRILYGNVCMVVCLVRFSYRVPGIHRSPRCQEEGDPLCFTPLSCLMEGSHAILTQPQRRDTQTLRRAHQVIQGQVNAQICRYTRHSKPSGRLTHAKAGRTIPSHSYSYSRIPSSFNYDTTKQTNKHRIVDMHSIIYTVRIV